MKDAHDFRDDEQKALSREYNLSQVMRCKRLFNHHTGRLKHDWAELAGHGAPTLHLLREKGWLGPGRFLGIDDSPQVLEGLKEQYGARSEHHEFFPDVLEDWLSRGAAQNVGVLNFDTEYRGGSDSFRDSLAGAVDFARDQEKLLGNFVLILNAGLDYGYSVDSFRESLLEQGITLCEKQLKKTGVLYGSSRPGRRSKRINYAHIFGPSSDHPNQER